MVFFKDIYLKEISPEDINLLYNLYKKNILKYYRPYISNFLQHPSQLLKRLEIISNFEPQVEIECLIFVRSKNIPIGLVSLQNIDSINKTAEINLIIFYNPRGIYGLQSICLSLYLSFFKIGLYKLYFYVSEQNQFFIKKLEKNKFIPEAILKDEIVCDNKRYNLYRYAIFKKDLSNKFWRKIFNLTGFDENAIYTK